MDILIVDDNKANLTLLSTLTRQLPETTATAFLDPLEAIAWSADHPVDLLYVDYIMPGMDGIEFIRRFRAQAHHAEVPIIMVTAYEERSVRYEALSAGANDFLNKPIDTIEFLARSRNLLALQRHSKKLADQAGWLRNEVEKATQEILRRELDTLFHLGKAAEFRDAETGAHILRMANYARVIAAAMGLSDADQEMLLRAAPMHDIGKLGTPDHILLKPGKLNPAEFEIMKQHAAHGWEILRHTPSPIIQAAAVIAHSHHEKWNGEGYPLGLRGEDIPLFGRIVAVADVFDALTSDRPYKQAWSNEKACIYIRTQSGQHFEPRCIDAFFSAWDEILAIQAKYRDEEINGYWAQRADGASHPL
ncbi:MAG: response regulator [Burkholderiaceae bacterium]|nr:MAG: response regulator [Burkholderiaceae bacterium]